jgi:hypothetical protein
MPSGPGAPSAYDPNTAFFTSSSVKALPNILFSSIVTFSSSEKKVS